MADLKYKPVRHNQKPLVRKASKRAGFKEAYDALAVEYAVAHEMLAARQRAGLTQEVVATRMGTTKSTVSRLESAGKHAPSLTSLKKYAAAVGCRIEIRLVSHRPSRSDLARVDAHTIRAHEYAELPELTRAMLVRGKVNKGRQALAARRLSRGPAK